MPVEVRADIASGWHIHANDPTEPFLVPSELQLVSDQGVRIGPVQYPPPETRSFSFAPQKVLRVYEGTVRFLTWIELPPEYLASEVRLEAKLRYQACTDTTCAPPVTTNASLLLPVGDAASTTGDQVGTIGPNTGPFDFAAWLEQRGHLATYLLVLLLGFGLNLTPCVYPLISVTLAYFGHQARQSFRHLVVLASQYVAGIVVSFASLGAAAALTGGLFGAWLQKPIVLIGAAGLMIVLALASFGVYQLRLPARWLRIAGTGSPGMLGAFLMGLSMGIVAAPCIGPVVVGLIVFVSSQKQPWLGLELFSALGLGLGLPYLALALAAGSLRALPRAGDWLVWVEHLFGAILLFLGWYFLSPLLPNSVRRIGYTVLIAAAGVGLGFLDRSGDSWSGFRRFKQLGGLAAVAAALWFAVPFPARSEIGWTPFSEEALSRATELRRPVVLDFVADWCIPCHEMDATTFADSRVIELASQFSMLRADLTLENQQTETLTTRFGVRGVPTLIVLNGEGTEVARFVGYVGPDELLSAMARALPPSELPSGLGVKTRS